MFIEEVYIRDILSHRESRVRFRRGLNVIIGPNGAGKSTIIDSIVYALLVYGAGSEEIKRASKADMIRTGASRGEIKVVFSIGGHRYELQRTLSLKGESEDILRQLSPVQRVIAIRSSVPKEIHKILGIQDPKILTSTVIARQDYLNEILLEEPSKRRERLLKLIGLDKIEKTREKINNSLKKLREEHSKIMLEIGRKKQLENELKKLEQELVLKREEFNKLKPQLDDLRRDLEKKEKKREKIQGLLQNLYIVIRYRDISDNIQRKKKELEEIREKFSLYKDLDREKIRELRNNLNANIKRINDLTKEMEERIKELSTVKEEMIRLINEAIMYLDKEKTDLLKSYIESNRFSEALDLINYEIEKINEIINMIRAQIQIYESFTKSFRETDRCPICGSPIPRDRLEHLLREHEISIKKLLGGLESRNIVVNKLRDLTSKVRDYARRIEKTESRLRELNDEFSMRRASVDENMRLCNEYISKILGKGLDSYDECIRSIDKVVEEYRVYEERMQSLSRDIESLERELRDLRDKVQVVERDLNEFLVSEALEKYVDKEPSEIMDLLNRLSSELANEISSLRKRYDELSKKVNSLEGEIRSRESDIRDKRLELEKLRDVELEMDKLEKIIKILEKLSELLKKDGVIVRILTTRLREALEKEINRILREIGRSFRVVIEENFEISILYGENQKRPVENLSGGERTMLSIAMRLALAKVLTGKIPRFMILDEPTQNLDADMRGMIFDIIKRIAGGMDQVIVVTHDEEVIDRADHLIRVVNEGGISRVIEG
jgi:exonuclease SbcC